MIYATHIGILTSVRSTTPFGMASLLAERSSTVPPFESTRIFGGVLSPVIFSAQNRSTSQLLRTV